MRETTSTPKAPEFGGVQAVFRTAFDRESYRNQNQDHFMETLSSRDIWTFLPEEAHARKVRGGKARAIPKDTENGHLVSNYRELARKIAELQFRNPEFVLLFRGQARDYPTTQYQSSIKPSIFRPEKDRMAAPDSDVIHSRYDILIRAERDLVETWGNRNLGNNRKLQRHRVVRWAILQHYEVCGTPLLDVTHSLRIAASFATKDALQRNLHEAFLMVLAIPQLSGAVTVTAEAELQALRLSSICPPEAVRPHLQEGYLLGEYPDLADPDQKSRVPHYEADFGRRLIAKFRLNPKKFWENDGAFPQVPDAALFPQEDDPVEEALAPLRTRYHTSS